MNTDRLFKGRARERVRAARFAFAFDPLEDAAFDLDDFLPLALGMDALGGAADG